MELKKYEIEEIEGYISQGLSRNMAEELQRSRKELESFKEEQGIYD